MYMDTILYCNVVQSVNEDALIVVGLLVKLSE